MFNFIDKFINSFNRLNDIDTCTYDSKYECLNTNFCKWCNISYVQKCYNIHNCVINQSDLKMCEYNNNLKYCSFQGILNILVVLLFISCMFYMLSIAIIRLLNSNLVPSLLTSLFILPALVLLSIDSVLVIYYSFIIGLSCIIIILLLCIINRCNN